MQLAETNISIASPGHAKFTKRIGGRPRCATRKCDRDKGITGDDGKKSKGANLGAHGVGEAAKEDWRARCDKDAHSRLYLNRHVLRREKRR